MASAPSEQGLPFPKGLHRSAYADREEWMASARFSTALLARISGRPRLEGAELLDVGCGTKITKALLDDGWPIARYVGVDVSADVISWLRANAVDKRFEFRRLDAQNDLYNPQGIPLPQVDRLPVGERPFDVICLFSVFTHLAPPDFSAMLRLLRPLIRHDGALVFSLFLTDPHGAWAELLDQALASEDESIAQRALEGISSALGEPRERFIDEVPETPLLRARYDRDYATELVEESGQWKIESISPPEKYIQNRIVCRPV